MIEILTELISEFIKNGIRKYFPEFRQLEVSLENPGEDTKTDFDTIKLYLYDIYENTELRNPAPVIEIDPSTGIAVTRKPDLMLSCSYLITAWPKKSIRNASPNGAILYEQRMLGAVARILATYSQITAEEVGADPGLVARIAPSGNVGIRGLDKDGGKSLVDLWNALKNNFKPSISITATISIPPLESNETYLLKVMNWAIGVRDTGDGDLVGDRLIIAAGSVECDGAPVKGAWVEIIEAGRIIRSREDGVFVFTYLAPGTYTLAVTAEGYRPEKDIRMEIPPKGGERLNINLKKQ